MLLGLRSQDNLPYSANQVSYLERHTVYCHVKVVCSLVQLAGVSTIDDYCNHGDGTNNCWAVKVKRDRALYSLGMCKKNNTFIALFRST